jgi:RNA polymerase sigma factor (sigma-70 family)
MRLASDSELLALKTLYEERLPVFVRTASAITRDPDAARDVVQEAFAVAIRRRRSLRNASRLEAWVWRIVVRLALESRSREGRVTWADQAEEPESPDVVGNPCSEVVEAIRHLPERQRVALFLRYYADMDYATVAEVLGVTSGTVGAALNAAHNTLKVRLERA